MLDVFKLVEQFTKHVGVQPTTFVTTNEVTFKFVIKKTPVQQNSYAFSMSREEILFAHYTEEEYADIKGSQIKQILKNEVIA